MENLNELASSSHHTEQLATKVILDKCDSSPNDQMTLDRVGRGHPVRIAVSPFAEDPKPLFQAGDIKTIHLDLNLTDRTTLKLNKHIRSAAGLKAVQTGMKKEMTENNHHLDSFFLIKLIDFVKIDKGVIVEDSTLCSLVQRCRQFHRLFEI